MNTAPGNMHDWDFERESARDIEIADAIAERIGDLEQASGHGKDEQALMQRVLDELFQSDIATEQLRRYLFEIWKQRGGAGYAEKQKMVRAAQAIANTIALPIRSIVSSDIHKEFGA